MPDSASSPKGGKGLTRKVGPLPVWGWAVIGFGIYYWYTHYGPGAATSTSGTGTASGRSLRVGNITITNTGGRGRAGRDVDTDKDTKPKTGHEPPHKCPKGWTWDPDAKPKPRCVHHTEPGEATGSRTKRKRPRPRGTGPDDDTRLQAGGGPQTVTVGGGFQPGGGAQPTGQAVDMQTGQPVFWEWEHKHRGPEIAEPVEAFAPQTSGAIHNVGQAAPAVDLASQAAGG